MINNGHYLGQSNNFKIFEITQQRLDEIAAQQYSYFKYCKANYLEFKLGRCYSPSNEELTEIRETLHEQRAQVRIKYDHGFENLFKSVRALEFDTTGMFIIDDLPMSLLFDPQTSNLEEMKFNHQWNTNNNLTNHLQDTFNEFEREYMQLQTELNEQGKQIKQLQKITHYQEIIIPQDAEGGIRGPRFIQTDC